jgi:hypothetical protein
VRQEPWCGERRPWSRAGGGLRVVLPFFPQGRTTIWPGALASLVLAIDRMVGADSDRNRPRRTRPHALGSAPSALPRLEASLESGAEASSKVWMNPLFRADSNWPVLDEPVAHPPLVVRHHADAPTRDYEWLGWLIAQSRARTALPSEESAMELSRLRGREPRLREYLHGFVRDLPLLWRERRHVAAPAQTGTDVCVDPRSLARDLVSEPVQLAYLLEQRLELRIVDSHGYPHVSTALREPLLPFSATTSARPHLESWSGVFASPVCVSLD